MLNAGYLTSNANTAWPFDPDNPRLDHRVSSLFADGAVVLKAEELGTRVTVENIAVTNKVLTFKAVINVDEGDDPVPRNEDDLPDGSDTDGQTDTSASFSVVASEDRPYSTVRSGRFFFVLDNASILSLEGLSVKQAFSLSPSAVSTLPERVSSFSLWNHASRLDKEDNRELECVASGVSGDVKLVGGTNVYAGGDIEYTGVAAAGSVLPNSENFVVLAAIAGAGEGTVKCKEQDECEDAEEGGSGGLSPDEYGNVVIEGDDCYQVNVSTDGKGNKVVKITGRCTPCCQCEDFVATNDRLSDQSQAVKGAYEKFVQYGTTYNHYADVYNRKENLVADGDLVVKCDVVSQFLGNAGMGSLSMRQNIGSVDRGTGVVSVANLSPRTMTVWVYATMSPQPLVMALVTTPKSTEGGYVADNETIKCSMVFTHTATLEPGSVLLVRLYGSRNATGPSESCRLTGRVRFSWTTPNGNARQLEKPFDAVYTVSSAEGGAPQ